MVLLNLKSNPNTIPRCWLDIEPTPKLIFVISPGAGTYKNKEAYQQLEAKYSVVYFGKSGDVFDKYPDNWQDNKLVHNKGPHLGGIYQATNWLYTGLSAKRTDWKIKGKEHLHGITIADEFRGKKNRVDLIKKKYGNNFYLKDRPLKHRYIYFTGNKKKWLKELNYKIQPYPKGQNKRYDASYKPTIQKELF